MLTYDSIRVDSVHYLAYSKFKFCFLELCRNFFPNIFNPQLVESTDMEPSDMESRLHTMLLVLVAES